MRAYFTLVARELSAYFASMTGYLVISMVLFLLGLSFSEILHKLNVEPTDAPITEQFFVTVYFWLILVLTTPVMTMRSFAFEKSSGTYESLMTAPVKDWQVVMAKFTGSQILYLIAWVPFAGYLAVVGQYSNDMTILTWRTMATTFLGLSLIGSLFISIGCFASSLARSPMVAAIVSYGLVMGLLLLSLRSLGETPSKGWTARVLQYFSMTEHMEDFARGIVDTRYLVLYSSLTVFFLFLTTKIVEIRRWR
ncbi:MAG: ABC transporter permease [Verrucomicrobia bacterium]|nr:ABC transporter permease [Verrucomicrobiota bacterium]